MTFREYLDYFESIVSKGIEAQDAPYNDPMYYDYTKLNWARTNRWLKTGELGLELIDAIKAISEPQHWIIITEPWCGDAAHNVPFLHMAAELNDRITVTYELRDSEPHRINEYLTNGGKSIPKLIIKDKEENDIATWGPRPADCQTIYSALTAEKADFEKVKTELQIWYNHNKGVDLQREVAALLQ
ncbi:MAG: thioredoxin family protein [Flavipsychrobacter sp.]|nr:thioredoxin family protein [Flavipsychrobacter sp.]